MNTVHLPQSACLCGVARCDVTPPVGIYHRMWGAALHDRATGVHRPLTATALWLAPCGAGEAQVVLGIDHCLLESEEIALIRGRVSAATGLPPEAVQVALSHTHGSGWLSRSRAQLPGGDLIGPYLDRVADDCAALAKQASAAAKPATIVYGTARCSLAAHRDFRDEATRQVVCGFNPTGPADDTVLVAKAVADDGATLGTVVNYACHPTTLAWENTLVSPDYVCAMREVVERHTGAPCLFLQGASGDLGPREGYVGDPAVADRNGRQLGFAALSALEALPPPGTRFVYRGSVVSGTLIGTWDFLPRDSADRARWHSETWQEPLPYRPDLATAQETRQEQAHWQAEQDRARDAGDEGRGRECRAMVEQMTRQLRRLELL